MKRSMSASTALRSEAKSPGGVPPFSGSTSGRVGVPVFHFIGNSKATHFTNQSGREIGVIEIRSVDHGLSPIVTRNESARWQIIRGAVMRPQRRVLDG